MFRNEKSRQNLPKQKLNRRRKKKLARIESRRSSGLESLEARQLLTAVTYDGNFQSDEEVNANSISNAAQVTLDVDPGYQKALVVTAAYTDSTGVNLEIEDISSAYPPVGVTPISLSLDESQATVIRDVSFGSTTATSAIWVIALDDVNGTAGRTFAYNAMDRQFQISAFGGDSTDVFLGAATYSNVDQANPAWDGARVSFNNPPGSAVADGNRSELRENNVAAAGTFTNNSNNTATAFADGGMIVDVFLGREGDPVNVVHSPEQTPLGDGMFILENENDVVYDIGTSYQAVDAGDNDMVWIATDALGGPFGEYDATSHAAVVLNPCSDEVTETIGFEDLSSGALVPSNYSDLATFSGTPSSPTVFGGPGQGHDSDNFITAGEEVRVDFAKPVNNLTFRAGRDDTAAPGLITVEVFGESGSLGSETIPALDGDPDTYRLVDLSGYADVTAIVIAQNDVSDLMGFDDFTFTALCECDGDLRFDFGDAPDSYGTTEESDGARHAAKGPRLGAARDQERDARANAGTYDGTGDDSLGADDEDGVVQKTGAVDADSGEFEFVAQKESNNTADLTVDVRGLQTGQDAYVSGWIDWNNDGVFQASESVFENTRTANGTFDVTVTIPESDSPDLWDDPDTDGIEGTFDTFMRVRVHSNPMGLGSPYLTPTGRANDGEVEDYPVSVYRGAEIEGTKYHDVNGNGSVDAEDEAWSYGAGGTVVNAPYEIKAGVWVGLFSDPSATVKAIDLFGNDVEAVETDENGNYLFPNLPSGTFYVAELLDLTDTNDDGVMDSTGATYEGYSIDQGLRWTVDADSVEVADIHLGECETVDLFNYVTGSIHGRKFHDENGNGVWDWDDDGDGIWETGEEGEQPLPDIVYTLKEYIGSTSYQAPSSPNSIVIHEWRDTELMATTGPKGHYWFEHLDPGQYAIFEIENGVYDGLTTGQETEMPGNNTDELNITFVDENLGDGNFFSYDAPGKLFDITSGLEFISEPNGHMMEVDLDGDGLLDPEDVAYPGLAVALKTTQEDPYLEYGNYEPITISGFKYEDVDNDGVYTPAGDGGEDVPFEGVKFSIFEGDYASYADAIAATPTPAMAFTNGNGIFRFDDLAPGTYTVFEDPNTNTGSNAYGNAGGGQNPDALIDTAQGLILDSTGFTITLESGDHTDLSGMDNINNPNTVTVDLDGDSDTDDTYKWHNYITGSIHGRKFHDLNGDGDWDYDDANGNEIWDNSESGEQPLPGIEYTLYTYEGPFSYRPESSTDDVVVHKWSTGPSTVTDAKGHYWFEGLLPGQYAIFETDSGDVYTHLSTDQVNDVPPMDWTPPADLQGVPTGDFYFSTVGPKGADGLESGDDLDGGGTAGTDTDVDNIPLLEIKSRVEFISEINSETLDGDNVMIIDLENDGVDEDDIAAARALQALKQTQIPLDAQSGEPYLRWGNVDPVKVVGFKYEDLNNDGYDAGDPAFEGVKFTLVEGSYASLGAAMGAPASAVVGSDLTDSDGLFEFLDLLPGAYTVYEDPSTDTTGSSYGGTTPGDGRVDTAQDMLLDGNVISFTVVSGTDIDLSGMDADNDPLTVSVPLQLNGTDINSDDDVDDAVDVDSYNWSNYITGSIHGSKFEDLNGDGIRNGDDAPLENVQYQLYKYLGTTSYVPFSSPAGTPAIVLHKWDREFDYVDQTGVDPLGLGRSFNGSTTNGELTVQTNAKGHFWFEGLLPGDYAVFETDSLPYTGLSTGQANDLPEELTTVPDEVDTPDSYFLSEDGPAKLFNIQSRVEYASEQDGHLMVVDLTGDGNSSDDVAEAELLQALKQVAIDPYLEYGNYEPITISGFKYEDVDNDGVYTPAGDGGEDVPFEGVKFSIFEGDYASYADAIAATPTPAMAFTNGNGIFRFDDLAPGTYTVFEDPNTNTGSNAYGNAGGGQNPDALIDTAQGLILDSTGFTITLESGDHTDLSGMDNINNPNTVTVDLDGDSDTDDTYKWHNYITGSIHGRKFHDLNGDGDWDYDDANGNEIWDNSESGEQPLPGIEYTLYTYEGPFSYRPESSTDDVVVHKWSTGPSTVTDAKGHYWFEGLLPGQYAIFETDSGDVYTHLSTDQVNDVPPMDWTPPADLQGVPTGDFYFSTVGPKGADGLESGDDLDGGGTAGTDTDVDNIPLLEIKSRVEFISEINSETLDGDNVMIIDLENDGVDEDDIAAARALQALKQTQIPLDAQSGEPYLRWGNVDPVKVVGFKYEDLNNDGYDAGDPAFEGVKFTLVEGSYASLGAAMGAPASAVVGSDLTDSDGLFEFLDLLPGAYTVYEDPSTDTTGSSYGGTTPGDGRVDTAQDMLLDGNVISFTVVSGTDIDLSGMDADNDPLTVSVPLQLNGTDINSDDDVDDAVDVDSYNWSNYITGSIHGSKFEDLNGDGIRNGDDAPLENVQYQLYKYLGTTSYVPFSSPAGTPAIVLHKWDREFDYVDQTGVDPLGLGRSFNGSTTNGELTVQTNAKGHFWFEGLLPGDYAVFETDSLPYTGLSTGQANDLPEELTTVPDEVDTPDSYFLSEDGPAKLFNIQSRVEYASEQDGHLMVVDLTGDGNSSDDVAEAELLQALKQVTVDPSLEYGNYEPITISGFKYEDVDNDGVYTPAGDGGEDVPFEGVKFSIFEGDYASYADAIAATPTPAMAFTNGNGIFRFDDLAPGTYTVFEDPNTNTGSNAYGNAGGGQNPDALIDTAQGLILDSTGFTITLESGDHTDLSGMDNINNPNTVTVDLDGDSDTDDTYKWHNYITGSIHGRKFHDLNGDGDWDYDDANGNEIWDNSESGEQPLPGIEYTLYTYEGPFSYRPESSTDDVVVHKWSTGPSTVTDAKGHYWFEGLLPGQYAIFETDSGDVYTHLSTDQVNDVPPMDWTPPADLQGVPTGDFYFSTVGPKGADGLESGDDLDGGGTAGTDTDVDNIPLLEIKSRVEFISEINSETLDGDNVMIIDLENDGVDEDDIAAARALQALKQTQIPLDAQSGEPYLRWGNVDPVKVVGFKYEDLNNDGYDAGDPAFEGVKFTLVEGSYASLGAAMGAPASAVVGSDLTDSDGLFEFLDLLPGAYTVYEDPSTDTTGSSYGGTTPGDGRVDTAQDMLLDGNVISFTVVSGTDIDLSGMDADNDPLTVSVPLQLNGTDINSDDDVDDAVDVDSYNWSNYITGSIHGSKFEDLNGDGIRNGDDAPLENVQYQLYKYLGTTSYVPFSSPAGTPAIVLHKWDREFDYVDQTGVDPLGLGRSFNGSTTNGELTVQTNAKGHFWFEGLLPGDYAVFETDSLPYTGLSTGQANDLPEELTTVPDEVDTPDSYFLSEDGPAKLFNIQSRVEYASEQDGHLMVVDLTGDGNSSDDVAEAELLQALKQVTVDPSLEYGNYEPITISGFKYEDVDNDGVYTPAGDGGEDVPFEGVKFSIFEGDYASYADAIAATPTPAMAFTNGNGIFRFDGLAPGTYTVFEDPNTNTGSNAYGNAGGGQNPDALIDTAQGLILDSTGFTITLESGDHTDLSGMDNINNPNTVTVDLDGDSDTDDTYKWHNYITGSIHGRKFHDLNGNGDWDYDDNNFGSTGNGIWDNDEGPEKPIAGIEFTLYQYLGMETYTAISFHNARNYPQVVNGAFDSNRCKGQLLVRRLTARRLRRV